jgi:membrane protease YdiL (CAAX protease family)
MKKPFLHALGAAVYIVGIVLLTQAVGAVLKQGHDTIIIPMTMLSLFVLSAAVMGYLFLSEPVALLIANRKEEAILFFGKVVGFFACFLVVFVALTFVITGVR